MRNAYRYLAMAVGTLVVVQAAAIAWAVFALFDGVDDGVVVDQAYDGNAGFALHSTIGWMVLPLVALALLVVGFLLRGADDAAALRWAGVVFGLVVLQDLLAVLSYGAAIVGVLHGINALVLLLVSVAAVRAVGRAPAPAGLG